MDPTDLVTPKYATLSSNAVLAAACLAAERVLDTTGALTDELMALIDHLWVWPTIDEHAFTEWESWTNPALQLALGGPTPEALTTATEPSAMTPDDLSRLMEHLVEIVYGNLFGAVDVQRTLGHLQAVEEIVRRYGIPLPPPSIFEGHPGSEAALLEGWGGRMTTDEVTAWRTAAW